MTLSCHRVPAQENIALSGHRHAGKNYLGRYKSHAPTAGRGDPDWYEWFVGVIEVLNFLARTWMSSRWRSRRQV